MYEAIESVALEQGFVTTNVQTKQPVKKEKKKGKKEKKKAPFGFYQRTKGGE